ncbi:unnamed protein product [Rhizopus stolonifer]
MAQFYEKLIAHLDNFEKNRLTEVAEKSITIMSSEKNTNYENPFCLSDSTFMDQESFDFLQSGFNSTDKMNLVGLQTTVIPESLMDLDNLHLFRNDPSNLFWSLPSEFDNNTLMTWLDNMNDVEWLLLEQSFE